MLRVLLIFLLCLLKLEDAHAMRRLITPVRTLSSHLINNGNVPLHKLSYLQNKQLSSKVRDVVKPGVVTAQERGESFLGKNLTITDLRKLHDYLDVVAVVEKTWVGIGIVSAVLAGRVIFGPPVDLLYFIFGTGLVGSLVATGVVMDKKTAKNVSEAVQLVSNKTRLSAEEKNELEDLFRHHTSSCIEALRLQRMRRVFYDEDE